MRVAMRCGPWFHMRFRVGKEIDTKAIFKELSKKPRGPYADLDVVASYMSRQEDAASGDEHTVVEYFDKEALHEFLTKRARRDQVRQGSVLVGTGGGGGLFGRDLFWVGNFVSQTGREMHMRNPEVLAQLKVAPEACVRVGTFHESFCDSCNAVSGTPRNPPTPAK